MKPRARLCACVFARTCVCVRVSVGVYPDGMCVSVCVCVCVCVRACVRAGDSGECKGVVFQCVRFSLLPMTKYV